MEMSVKFEQRNDTSKQQEQKVGNKKSRRADEATELMEHHKGVFRRGGELTKRLGAHHPDVVTAREQREFDDWMMGGETREQCGSDLKSIEVEQKKDVRTQGVSQRREARKSAG
jgi:hypothetical protein